MATGALAATPPPVAKPKLSLSGIINMSVGFFGIQFGWDLQRANMGPIYDVLGANPDDIPFLSLAAPLTGLIVQPIIGFWPAGRKSARARLGLDLRLDHIGS